MIVDLGSFKFPIPFRQIYLSEKQTIEMMHNCRGQANRQLFGENRSSNRMTIIVICYLLTSMVLFQCDKPRSKNIIYLCKSEQRKKWLLAASQKTRQFLSRELDELKLWTTDSDLEMAQKFYGSEMDSETQINTFSSIQRFHKYYRMGATKQKLLQGYVNDITICGTMEECQSMGEKQRKNPRKGILVIMQVKRYISHKILLREYQQNWQHVKDSFLIIDTKIGSTMFSWICRHLNYLFIETNDLEGLLEENLSRTISDVIVYRAGLEMSKINKFYNFRFDNKAREKAKSLKKVSQNASKQKRIFFDKKDRPRGGIDGRVESLQQIHLNKEGEKSSPVKRQEQLDRRRKNRWRVESTDKLINDLGKQKMKLLQAHLSHRRGDPTYLPVPGSLELGGDQMKNLKCYTLLHMQIINYFLNYLLIHEFKETGDVPDTHFFADKYPGEIFKKTSLPLGMFSKYRVILKSLIAKIPPRVGHSHLSTFYLEQVLQFYEKVVVWEKVFKGAEEGVPANKFLILRYRVDFQAGAGEVTLSKRREYHMKLTTFDQKAMLELLGQGTKSICCFQNQGLYFDYYEEMFKPSRFTTMTLEYRCPTVNAKLMKSATIGMIINSTPNDEDLHINSDHSGVSHELSDLQSKRYDKEHYSQIIRSYGVLIHDLCEIVPDGLVVYFPTREILRECRAEWEVRENIYERICHKKKVFEEEVWAEDNAANLAKYRKLCDVGRGAVFFVSAHSDFGRDTAFFNHYSKCIVFVGVPYEQINVQVEQKIQHLKLKEIFRFKMAMRVVARCLSNCINDPAEVKVVIFADDSFGKNDIRKKWFPFIEDGNLNTSTIIEQVVRINSKTYQALAIRERMELELSESSNLRRLASSSSFRF